MNSNAITLTDPQREILLFLHDRRNAASAAGIADGMGLSNRERLEFGGTLAAMTRTGLITKSGGLYTSTATGRTLAINIARALKAYGLETVEDRREARARRKALAVAEVEPATKPRQKGRRAS